MARLLYTPAALSDIEEIWDFTAQHWGEAQAASYLRQITTACAEVAAGTRSAQAIDEIRPGYRKLRVQSHSAFLRQSETGDWEAVRILHQRMDVARHLPTQPSDRK